MNDIIVTTPKSEMATSAREAANCLADGGGKYFRVFHRRPAGVVPGSRVYYVEDGFIRGYAVVEDVQMPADGVSRCDTTGRDWQGETRLVMAATSWRWIRPVPMRGFQGWRYAQGLRLRTTEVGGWRDPKPLTSAEQTDLLAATEARPHACP